MRIGYACVTIGVPGTAQHTCIAKNATPEKLREVIGQNLTALANQLDYNAAQGIRVFRVSSDIIPFGSSPVNTLDWAAEFAPQLAALGEKARGYGMRLSMHPGQYTVLNSPDGGVVERAVEDLAYHTHFLDALGMDTTCKLVLHIGGVYGDKPAAIQRFCESYARLPAGIKQRLILENDDKLYNAEDVLAICQRLGAPMVFDTLHNKVNPSTTQRSESEWILAAWGTWKPQDGPQKIHYSQQAAGRKPGSHSDTIAIGPFLQLYAANNRGDLDVMLEVKDKNLSAEKCIDCTMENGKINRLEQRWAKYKYTVLEHDAAVYNQIRALLKDKAAYPAVEFYTLLEKAMNTPVTTGGAANAAQHVWGYFKGVASEREKASFQKQLAAYTTGEINLARLKAGLKRLAIKYSQPYLLDSTYFL